MNKVWAAILVLVCLIGYGSVVVLHFISSQTSSFRVRSVSYWRGRLREKSPEAKLAGMVAYGGTVKVSERVYVFAGVAESVKVKPMLCVELEARRLGVV